MRGLLQPLKNLLPKHQLKPNVVLIRKHSPSTHPDLLRSTFEPICHPPSRSYTPTTPSEASLLWAKSGFFRRLFSSSHSPCLPCRRYRQSRRHQSSSAFPGEEVAFPAQEFARLRRPSPGESMAILYVISRSGSLWIDRCQYWYLLTMEACKSYIYESKLHDFIGQYKNGRIHTLVTSAFSHVDGFHIFSNMIGLYFFGSPIGMLFGPQFLLKLYLAGALGGSIFFLLHKVIVARSDKGVRSKHLQYATGLGVSGAVTAVILLNIFLIPMPAPALSGAIIIGIDLWSVKQGDTHVSGSAHLGGAVVAALARARIPNRFII